MAGGHCHDGHHTDDPNCEVNLSQDASDEDIVPEGGWGWVIVASNFCMMTLVVGYVTALSVFFVEWLHYFDTTATEISWVTSLPPTVLGVFSPFSGTLITRYGSRKVAFLGSTIFFLGVLLSMFAESVLHLFITAAFMTGIGGALIFTPSMAMLVPYFKKRYVLANSIAFCGYSFGQTTMPRICQLLVEMYGWRGAILVLAAILAHLFACAALLRPRSSKSIPIANKAKHDTVSNSHTTQGVWSTAASGSIFDNVWNTTTTSEGQQEDNHLTFSNSEKPQMVKHKWAFWNSWKSCLFKVATFLKEIYGLSVLGTSGSFVLTLLSTFAGSIGWFVTFGLLVARAVSSGISRNNAAFLVTVMGIGGFTGRAGHGLLIGNCYVTREILFIASFGVTAISNLLNPLLDTFPSLCGFALVFGVSQGTASTLVYAILKLQVATSEAAAAISFGSLAIGLASLVGIVLAGWLFDKTENYDASFYFAGSSILTGTLLLSVVYVIDQKRKRTQGDATAKVIVENG